MKTQITHAARFNDIPVRNELGSASVAEFLAPGQPQLKVAVAQITTYPGQIEFNKEKIIACIAKAKAAGADVIVFPELTVPGYAAMDLFFRKDYIRANLRALEEIRRSTHGITAIVGFADADYSKMRPGERPALHNSAAIIQDGKIVHVQDKSLYPNYDIFFEDRYFGPSRGQKVVSIKGVPVGIQICEDLWSKDYSVDPTEQLVKKGAKLVINLSASPLHIGKVPVRYDLISRTAAKHHVPFVYTNLVGAQDGYEGDVVFDGRSMVFGADGSLASFGGEFKEEIILHDPFNSQKLTLPKIDQTAELHDALVTGIREYFARLDLASASKGPNHAIIGASGGVDSALVAALAVEALGADRVVLATMPSRHSSAATRGDAALLAEKLGTKFKTIPIEVPFSVVRDSLRADPEFANLPEGVAEENIQARLRMINLMYLANAGNGLVLNTGNKTELALNNCTIYGDMVGGFSVLGDVDKDRIYDLCRYINAKAGTDVIPQTTIDRVPTAELKPNQVDADVMGAAPQIIAPLVRAIVEGNLSPEEAIQQFGSQFNPNLIRDTFKKLDRSEWKRRQASPGIRVTPHAFGNGRRFPISHGFDEQTLKAA